MFIRKVFIICWGISHVRNRITDIKKITFKKNENSSGGLSVYQSGELVPFDIKRVFVVSANKGEERGHHAHINCIQLLVAVAGEIEVEVSDVAKQSVSYSLRQFNEGLLIPPGIWASQRYIKEGSVLMVLCDHEYDESDYIRDYEGFSEFNKGGPNDR